MALAAFLVSMAALILSGGAVWYTRTSSVAQREMADIDRARRADELAAQTQAAELAARATLTLGHDVQQIGRSVAGAEFEHAIVVTNDGPSDANDVVITIETTWDGAGTLPFFAADKTRSMTVAHKSIRVGKVIKGRPQRLLLHGDERTNFDVCDCRIRWSDGSRSDAEETLRVPPAES
jgi:hypothetical protein